MKRKVSSALVGAAFALVAGTAAAQISDGVIKIGVLNDMSSLYADLNGDGKLEIVVGGKNSISGTATYQAWKHDGSLAASGAALENGTYSDPAMASFDTNEDGSDELLMVGEVDEGTFGLEIRNALNGEIEFSTTFTSSAASLYCGNLL